MFKEKIIKSTLILMIGGLITKLLGMFIRIVMTRTIGIEGIGIYMLIFPTFSFFMSLSQLSFLTSISKLISYFILFLKYWISVNEKENPYISKVSLYNA